MTLDKRKSLILQMVVEQFVKTGEPVGSKFVATAMEGIVSSATIRNDMALLEGAGLLEQPHTSSGRVPTHLGYRLYIDKLLFPTPLNNMRKAEIDAMFNVRNADPDQLLQDTAQFLAELTGLAAICTTNIPKSVTVSHVEIIPAGARTVVILLIASSGVIKNKVCRVDFNLSPAVIEFFLKFTEAQLVGRSLEEITSSYLSSVSVNLGEYARLFMPIFAALYDLVREINQGQYFIKGSTNLLGFSELSAVAYDLLRFIEERETITEIICNGHIPMQVLIGNEAATAQLSESSVLIARYNIGQNAQGAIALLGPVRMNYSDLLPHLEYFAQKLGGLLQETYIEQ